MGARFWPAIPAVILLVLHSGCARGLGSVCSPKKGVLEEGSERYMKFGALVYSFEFN